MRKDFAPESKILKYGEGIDYILFRRKGKREFGKFKGFDSKY